MNIHTPTDHVKTVGQNANTATETGAAVDAYGYTVALATIVATTDASSSIAFKVQESADGSTGWADVASATQAVPASQTDKTFNINLNLKVRKRYIRLVSTVTGAGAKYGALVTLFNPSYHVPTQEKTPVSVVV